MTRGIIELFEQQCTVRPEAVACADESRHWSFDELQRLGEQLAAQLHAEGLQTGDRVAVLTRSHLDALVVMLSAQRLGLIFMPLNWRLALDEQAYVLQHGAPRLVIADADLAMTYAPVLNQLPHWVDAVQALPMAQSRPTLPARSLPQLTDAALLLYSSGTTGRPKGVLLSAQGMMSAIRIATLASGFDADSSMINALPVFHIAGIISLLMPLVAGGRLEGMDRFEPRAFAETVARRAVSHTTLVPSMIQSLIAEDAEMSSLQRIIYAGSPISEPVLKAAMTAFGSDFIQIYGLTEATGIVSVLSIDDHQNPELWRSAGRTAVATDVRIADPRSGAPMAEREVGEIWVRSERTMLSYWNDPQASAQASAPGGWLRTGDCGYMHDVYLYLTDRLKDQIVSGGENVYPAEIERVLVQHRAVADCAVIGVPDDKWGETVKACVVLRFGAEVTAAELMMFCRERLAHFKCPTSVDFHDTLPRNASGKVLKRELRAPYWQGMARAVC